MVCWSQEELERMRTTIEDFVSLTGDRDREGERESSVPGEELGLAQPPQKDGLAFHGIVMDSMETSSKTEDLKRNFLDHNIRRILYFTILYNRFWSCLSSGISSQPLNSSKLAPESVKILPVSLLTESSVLPILL